MTDWKREVTGGRKVFELKKEKKRRLILSDSESEEHDAFPPPRKRAASGVEQNGCEKEHKVDGEKRDASSDSVKQRKEVIEKRSAEENRQRDVKSEAGNHREEAGADRGKTAGNGGEKIKPEKESATRLVVFKRRVDGGSDKKKPVERNNGEMIKVSKQIVARPDANKQTKEAGSYRRKTVEEWSDDEVLVVDKKKAGRFDAFKQKQVANIDLRKATERAGAEEPKVEKKRDGRLDDVKRRQDASIDLKKTTERRTAEEEPKVGKKMAVSVDVVKKREETGIYKNKATDRRNSDKELRFYKKMVMSSDIFKQREEFDSDKKRATEKRNSSEKLKVNQHSVVKSDVINQRVEIGAIKKKSSELGSHKEDLIIDNKRAVRPDAIKQREGAGIDKKKATELDSENEELTFDKKRSNEVKRREEAGSDKKKSTESGSCSKSDRKRSRETTDAEISSKRIKIGLNPTPYQTKMIDGKKLKLGSHKYGDGRTETKGDWLQGSRPVVPVSKQQDRLREKKLPVELEKTIKPDAEKVRWIKSSGQRTLQKLKDNNVKSVGIKREEPDTSRDKNIRVQGKDAISTVLPSNKKVEGLEKVHIRGEEDERVKNLTHPISSTIATHSTPKPPSLCGGKIDFEKSNSTVTLCKDQLNMKTSSAEKHVSREVKTKLKSSSLEPKNKGMSSTKPVTVPKGKSNSSSKAHLPAMQSTEEATVGRGTVKRNIREQIKCVLLDAGWKIDLRPRRGRNYEDQVYIPPTGGSGYWSITKAYAVFQEQSNHACDDRNLNSSGKSSKECIGSDKDFDGTGSSSSIIPLEFLSMLKRKTGNKMRGKIEVEETEGNRSKKAKETAKMKHVKNKTFKDSIDGVRGRKKSNSLVGLKKGSVERNTTKRRGCALLVRRTNQEAEAEYDDYVPYIWKRTVFSWMIDLGIVPLNGKVKYVNKKQTHLMLEGQIMRDGILCSCCSKILTVSKFEIHAGSKLHQPYENINVEESGISLLQCQLNAWEKQDETERQGYYTLSIEGDDPNDDTCGICGDGGDLMCCDGCPSTFHQSCLGIETLPSGDWYCSNCSCRFCGLVSEASAQESRIPVSPLLSCSQCEEKYHQECVPEEDAISTSSNISCVSFCGKSCRKVFRRLQKLLGVRNGLEAGFSWRLVRRLEEDSPLSLFGLPQRAECNAKIAVALAIMDECFLPIIDQRSGLNLIHNVVYNCGSNFNRLNYNGFYTFILERGDEIISAASVRFHGTRLAEMPFIGTRNMYRRQGMARRLLNGIESALSSLGIQNLIIPAISELTDTWTTVFGFKPLEISEKQEIKSINLLVFPDTGLLQKSMLKISYEPTNAADKIECGIEHHPTLVAAAESYLFSSAGTESLASDEVLVSSQEVVKDVEHNLNALDSCTPSTSTIAPECLNDSVASECQASDCKSPEKAADANLSQPEAVCHDGFVEGHKFQVNSLTVSKIKSPYKVILHDNHDAEIEDADVASKSHAVENSLSRRISEAKCTASDDTVSAVLNSGAKAYANLPCIDDTLLPHNSEDYCTSSCVSSSAIQDSGGNNLHFPVSSLESISDVTDHRRSIVRSTSDSAVLVEHGLQVSGECTLDSNQDIKDRVATFQPELNAYDDNSEHCNLEIVTGSVDPVINKFCPASMDSKIHAAGEDAVNAILEERNEVTAANPKLDANNEESEPCISVGRSLDVPFREESQASDGNSLTYIADVITRPVCAASGYGLHVSNVGKPSQQDIQLAKESAKVLDVAPPVTEKLHHNEHNSVDALHLSSVLEPKVSSTNGLLERSHEINNDCCSFGHNSCAVDDNTVIYHGSDTICSTPNVSMEPILSLSGGKSCKISGASAYGGAAYSLMSDAVNNSLGMVANSSASFVHGGSDHCASMPSDIPNESFGTASVAPVHWIIPESAYRSAEGTGELDDLCKNKDAVSAEVLNKFLGSTSVVIQHSLNVVDLATACVPLEPSNACSEGASDTGISKDELALVKPVHSFGLNSANCASKEVTVSLDRNSESPNASADVNFYRTE